MHLFFFFWGGGVGLNKVGSLWSMRKLLIDDAIGSPENSFLCILTQLCPVSEITSKWQQRPAITLTPPSLPWTRKISKAAGSLGARKVSPDWSLKTMTCHSFNCFSIVCAQGQAPLVTSLPSNCYVTLLFSVVFLPFSALSQLTQISKVQLVVYHQCCVLIG